MRRWREGNAMLHDFQQSLATAIGGGADLSPPLFAGTAERRTLGLRVYRNNSAHARVEALKDAYPAVLRLVGEDCFQTLALDMAARCPSPSAEVRDWAMRLPAFIVETPLAEMLPYLADVARVEAAWLAAYHGADPVPAPIEVLTDPDALAQCWLSLSATTTVIRSAYPVQAIWLAQRERGDFGGDGPADCIVYRSGLTVEVESLSSVVAAALAALNAPMPALDWFASIADNEPLQTKAASLLTAGSIQILSEMKNDSRRPRKTPA